MRLGEPLAYVTLLLAASLACGGGEKAADKGGIINATAVDITREYSKSATAGDAKWGGKTVRVTGIGHYHATCPGSSFDTPCVMLEGLDTGSALIWVYGWITNDKPAPSIAPMSTITLKCQVPEEGALASPLGVDLQDCDILSSRAAAASTAKPRTPPATRPQPRRPPAPRRR